MVMKRVILLALFVLSLPGSGAAQKTYDRLLAGIGPVQVLVDVPGEYLHPDAIHRDVVARLRAAGVPVGDQVTGYLYVKMRVYCDPSGLCAFSIDLSIDEDVQVFRNGVGFVAAAITWQSLGTVGYVDLEYVSDIAETVKDEVDEFVNAYRTANPER